MNYPRAILAENNSFIISFLVDSSSRADTLRAILHLNMFPKRIIDTFLVYCQHQLATFIVSLPNIASLFPSRTSF